MGASLNGEMGGGWVGLTQLPRVEARPKVSECL